MIAVGARVGSYQVMSQIGAGAMGKVFLAQAGSGKRVAVKVIHAQHANNEEMIARFFNEARAVTQIGHPNIVEVEDFGQTPDGDSFIVMELLEGQSLTQAMKSSGVFPVTRATHIVRQIAEGLAAAHARGIVHRDLKPDNLFLIARGGDSDFVKVLDFGLAKLLGPAVGPGMIANKTKTGSLLGTPHYMAPEQCEGKKDIDQRVDVYSLGCILFQLLTGRVPFPGVGYGEVVIMQLREPPPLPSRLNPAVSPSIEKIILRALAKKPEYRFASMNELSAALAASAPADAPTAVRPSNAAAAAALAKTAPGANAAPARPRGRRVSLAIAGIALGVALALFCWRGLRRSAAVTVVTAPADAENARGVPPIPVERTAPPPDRPLPTARPAPTAATAATAVATPPGPTRAAADRRKKKPEPAAGAKKEPNSDRLILTPSF